MKTRRDDLRNHLRIMERRNGLTLEERWEGMVLKPRDEIDLSWMDERVN